MAISNASNIDSLVFTVHPLVCGSDGVSPTPVADHTNKQVLAVAVSGRRVALNQIREVGH
jgi:hypothetical protein